jgi:hypothetical protein
VNSAEHRVNGEELRALIREIIRDVIQTELRGLVHQVVTDQPTALAQPNHAAPAQPDRTVPVFPPGPVSQPARPGIPVQVKPVRRVDRGAVTERIVRDAARAGERLVLGRAAVLTPLGADRARAEGVPIEKEH